MHSFARLCTAFGLNFSSFDSPALPAPDDPGAEGRGVVAVERLSSRPFGGAIGFVFIAEGPAVCCFGGQKLQWVNPGC